MTRRKDAASGSLLAPVFSWSLSSNGHGKVIHTGHSICMHVSQNCDLSIQYLMLNGFTVIKTIQLPKQSANIASSDKGVWMLMSMDVFPHPCHLLVSCFCLFKRAFITKSIGHIVHDGQGLGKRFYKRMFRNLNGSNIQSFCLVVLALVSTVGRTWHIVTVSEEDGRYAPL
jgi:hypothetical protein